MEKNYATVIIRQGTVNKMLLKIEKTNKDLTLTFNNSKFNSGFSKIAYQAKKINTDEIRNSLKTGEPVVLGGTLKIIIADSRITVKHGKGQNGSMYSFTLTNKNIKKDLYNAFCKLNGATGVEESTDEFGSVEIKSEKKKSSIKKTASKKKNVEEDFDKDSGFDWEGNAQAGAKLFKGLIKGMLGDKKIDDVDDDF